MHTVLSCVDVDTSSALSTLYVYSLFSVGDLSAYPGGDQCGGASQGVVFTRRGMGGISDGGATVGVEKSESNEKQIEEEKYTEHEEKEANFECVLNWKKYPVLIPLATPLF